MNTGKTRPRIREPIVKTHTNTAELMADIEKLKESLKASAPPEQDRDQIQNGWEEEIDAEFEEDDDEDMGEPTIMMPDGTMVHEVLYFRDGKECAENGEFLTAYDEEEYDVDGNEVLL